jgi:hypothetical protein
MKRLVVSVFTVIIGLSLAAGAIAQDKAGKSASQGQVSSEQTSKEAKKPTIKKENVVTVNATVQAIDLGTRVVTLKGPKGNVFDLKVGEEAKNLPQVKVGDLVVAKYYESIAVEVKKPGEPGGVTASGALATAKPGEMPAGVVAKQVTVTTTVEAIDRKKTHVTLKGPEGNSVKVKVQDPKNLKNVKVGDQVIITYTEALAISVEKPKKK